ncbi:hypothetical protein DH2020_003334 [Rehmannia glutinosa]|uniref:Apyrase n=1 Tax=Rehmannia glutinosa TaxID=99300 RepID=A0ABR0XLG1_REHGL
MRRPNARTVNPNLEENKDMDPIKFHSRPTRPGFRSPNSRHSNPRSRFCLYTSISIALVLFCYILFFGNKNRENKKYGVVIDGGSTGTRIHVFKYDVKNGNLVLDFSEKGLVSMRVNPGLSAHIEDPERAGDAVAELVEFAKRNVPREQWGGTEIRLMATAGMRLLRSEDQERILNGCRRILRVSGFRFRDDWATVISGSDEGLYAWVVANYALGTLGAEPAQTTGIIELGGASAQVTFVSNEPMPPEFSRKIKFGNFTYNLYSHSLLQFGQVFKLCYILQNVALELLKESLVSEGQGLEWHSFRLYKFKMFVDAATESLQRNKPMDPCTPRGYAPDKEAWKLSPTSLIEKNRYPSTLLPSGNFSECRSASLKLLQKDQGQRAFLSDLVVAGQQFCGEDWSKLTQKYNFLEEEDLLRYCFSSAYIVAMLHDSLGIDLHDQRVAPRRASLAQEMDLIAGVSSFDILDHEGSDGLRVLPYQTLNLPCIKLYKNRNMIGYANQVDNIPLDWALGAFILQSAANLDANHSDWMATIIGMKRWGYIQRINVRVGLDFTQAQSYIG